MKSLNISSLVLVLANVTPLLGVIFFSWDARPIIVLFWLENIIVGYFNIAKMARVKIPWGHARSWNIFGFIFHYGWFCFIHGVVLFGFLGIAQPTVPSSLIDVFIFQVQDTAQIIFEYDWPFWVAIFNLVLSHGFSTIKHFFLLQEWKRTTLQKLQKQPYIRVMGYHIVIFIGCFFVLKIDELELALTFFVVPLIFLKVCIDLYSHRKEHSVLTKQ